MCLRRNTKCAHFRGSDILHETRKQMGDIISYSLFGLHFGGLKPLANMNFSENLHWLLDTFKLLYVHDDYISQACSGVPYSLRIFSGFFTQSVKKLQKWCKYIHTTIWASFIKCCAKTILNLILKSSLTCDL